MGSLRPVWLTAVALLCVAAAPQATQARQTRETRQTSTRAVIMRTYNNYGLPSPEVQTASHTVRGLLSSVDIDARWRNCRASAGQ